jgi:hypothetical protein
MAQTHHPIYHATSVDSAPIAMTYRTGKVTIAFGAEAVTLSSAAFLLMIQQSTALLNENMSAILADVDVL